MLSFSEVRFFSDPTWVRVMEDASVVAARDEVARQVAEAKRRGEATPSPEERARVMEALERARRPWPLNPVLVLAVVTGLIAGVVRGTRQRRAIDAAGEQASAVTPLPGWRLVGGVVTALAMVICVIATVRELGASLPP